jgi:hypothetical protein
MIYMVEMDLADGTRKPEWHDWYLAHIKKLLTVPGFNASQRFQALTPTPSPWLALHDVSSGAVFESPDYRAKGGPSGTGEWQARMTNWYRNLFDGLAEAPEVPQGAHLIVIEAGARLPAGLEGRVTWLTSVGLDRSARASGSRCRSTGDGAAGRPSCARLQADHREAPRVANDASLGRHGAPAP